VEKQQLIVLAAISESPSQEIVRQELRNLEGCRIEEVQEGGVLVRKIEGMQPAITVVSCQLEGVVDAISAAAILREQTNGLLLLVDVPREPEGYFATRMEEVAPDATLPENPNHEQVNKTLSELLMTAEQRAEEARAYIKRNPIREMLFHKLSTLPIIGELPEETLTQLVFAGELIELKKGEIISAEDDPVERAFLVIEGRIAFVKTSENGKELAVEVIAPGDTLGLLLSVAHYAEELQLRAQVDSEVFFIPRQEVVSALELHAIPIEEITEELLTRLSRAQEFARSLAHDRVDARIAAGLVSVISKLGSGESHTSQPISIELTRQQLADMAGTTQETVIRTLKKFEQSHVLEPADEGVITVANFSQLSRIAGG